MADEGTGLAVSRMARGGDVRLAVAASAVAGQCRLPRKLLETLRVAAGDALEVVRESDGRPFLCHAWPCDEDAEVAASADLSFSLPRADDAFEESRNDSASSGPHLTAVHVRRPPSAPSPPPLLQSVWLRVPLWATRLRPLQAQRLRLRLQAALNGRLVRAGGCFQLGGSANGPPPLNIDVVRVASGGGSEQSRLGRATCRTQLHLDAAKVAQAERAPSAGHPAGSRAGILPAQRRAHEAICALVRASRSPEREALMSWRVRPPSGLLLSGPPGTGKTHLVRAVAAAFGAPLVSLSGGTGGGRVVVSGSVEAGGAAAQAGGGSAADAQSGVPGVAGEELGVRLREAFGLAEQLSRRCSAARGEAVSAILMLDELDAMCPKRSEAATTAEQARAVAVLLTLLDGLRSRHGCVLAVGATNRPHAIDEALRRPGRLEWEVPLTLPTASERQVALQMGCRELALDATVDLAVVAEGCSGYAAADLIALVREATLHAAREQAAAEAATAAAEAATAAAEAATAAAEAATAATEAATVDASGDTTLSGAIAASTRMATAAPAPPTSAAPVLRAADFSAAVQSLRASVLRPSSSAMPPVEPLAYEAIGGLPEVKLRIRRAVEWPTKRAAAYSRLGIHAPRGVLLHGPPGCAKTSLARAAAGACGVTFIYLSGASLYSPYVGEAERQLREVFTLGRACHPSIVFIDELEAIVGSRSAQGGGGGGDAVRLRVLSTLLNEMDGISSASQVVVIGATNQPSSLDAALLRPGRFDEVIEVGLLDGPGRAQVLSVHTHAMPLAADVSLDQISEACDGWSGAQLAALCQAAAMTALRESMDAPCVASHHFASAMQRVH